MRLLFCSGKGGVGKSTMAFLFAVTLHRVGKTISIRDLDPQESLTAWIEDAPDVRTVLNGDIELIDVPPRIDDTQVIGVIREADIIIIPTIPSPAETAVARASAAVIQQHKRQDARAVITFNRVKRGTIYARGVEELAVQMPLPVTKAFLSEREAYKHVLLEGWSALDPQSRDEITSLALEIQ
jgi:chromosome partitioning protein